MNTRKATVTNTYSTTPATWLYLYDLNSIEKLKKKLKEIRIKQSRKRTKSDVLILHRKE